MPRQPKKTYALPSFAQARDLGVALFIALHCVMIASWAIPSSSVLTRKINALSAPYLSAVGLWQGWDMFSPDPAKSNRYLEAEITYQDGSQKVWAFPRMEKLSLRERYAKERYRKWANDNVRVDTSIGLWPDTVRYIARLNDQAANHPVSVHLIRSWTDIPSPEEKFFPSRSPASSEWHRYDFFQMGVLAGDLK